jgi:hypothetical protein
MPSLRRAVQTTDYQGDRHMSVGDGLPHEFYAGVAWRLRPIVLPPLRNERPPREVSSRSRSARPTLSSFDMRGLSAHDIGEARRPAFQTLVRPLAIEVGSLFVRS